ncbi:MAG: ribonuclease III [Phycisphaeraceae bacterium]|nr:MAG: ribonuclease III [Phycisphaeraceae bacterium]
MDELLAEAQRAIGIDFKDLDLLELSLRHASHSDSRLDSNERLEFLGDAVLGMVTCERIFELFPELLEGEMTKIKSTVVSRKTCADIAERMGLDNLLILGKGMQSQERVPRSLAAAVFESVIAAVYLDQGFKAAKAFLLPLIDPMIEEAEQSGHQQNFKSVLQQHAQQEMGESPAYRVLDEKGPDHAKCFKVAVELAGRLHTACWGQSKKQAEQQAAQHALHELGVIARDEAGRLRLVDDAMSTDK